MLFSTVINFQLHAPHSRLIFIEKSVSISSLQIFCILIQLSLISTKVFNIVELNSGKERNR